MSDLQQLRLTRRPLLSLDQRIGAVARLERTARSERYELILNEGATWADGEEITKPDVLAGLSAGARRFEDYVDLCGLSVVGADGRTIRIEAKLGIGMLEFLLSHPGFTPRRVCSQGSPYSGDYLPSTEPGHFLHRSSRHEVVLRVESDAARARSLFEAGELDVTCPSCFELAKGARDERFIRSETNLNALLVFNPGRLARLSSFEGRSALASELRLWTGDEEGVVLDPALSMLPQTSVLPDTDELELVFADYWPNAEIMQHVRDALGRLGVQAPRLRRLGLHELGHTLTAGQFDIALVIYQGMFGVDVSSWARLAVATARLLPEHRQWTVERFRRFCRGDLSETALAEDLLGVAPLLPLGRFVSGYLSRDPERMFCLGNDPVINLEESA